MLATVSGTSVTVRWSRSRGPLRPTTDGGRRSWRRRWVTTCGGSPTGWPGRGPAGSAGPPAADPSSTGSPGRTPSPAKPCVRAVRCGTSAAGTGNGNRGGCGAAGPPNRRSPRPAGPGSAARPWTTASAAGRSARSVTSACATAVIGGPVLNQSSISPQNNDSRRQASASDERRNGWSEAIFGPSPQVRKLAGRVPLQELIRSVSAGQKPYASPPVLSESSARGANASSRTLRATSASAGMRWA